MKWRDCKRGRFSVVFARKIIEITNDYERFYERDIIRRLFFVKEAAKNQGEITISKRKW